MAEEDAQRTRNEKWFQEHAIRGVPLRTIAQRDGVGVSTVHDAIRKVRGTIPEEKREAVITDVLAFYAKVREEAWKLADLPGAPVTAGKDGDVLYDPNTGNVVRDYSGRLRALETAMRTVEHERKVLGLDAAVKVEQVITDQAAADKAAKEASARLESETEEETEE